MLQTEFFKNRLRKVWKHWSKWARRRDIGCFRVYDDDLPEFPLAIDRYEDIIHISEYARDHQLTPEEHVQWLEESIAVVSEVMDVHPDRIFLKYRQRQSGWQQYERFARKGAEFIVREQGLKFIINASDYLDTGLFLDHRQTRNMVRESVKGLRVLNLFAYTGSFSVYAASGGASEVLTVDMSNTYLQWADRNMQLNGFSDDRYRFLQADITAWLRSNPADRFDLIVLDPPTFSNSKRMDGTLDIQRDHAWLIDSVLRLGAPGAQVFFSTNHRKFKLDTAGFRAGLIKDISSQTVPEDFRNKKIHQCFLIQK